MERLISSITEFIFVNDEARESDIIFIPGCSRPELAEKAAELFNKNLAPYILPSGRYSITADAFPGPASKRGVYNGDYKTEHAFLKDVLIKNGVPGECVLTEDKAAFTKENAFLSRQVCDDSGITVRRAILCCKPYHARRALIYYQLAFPETVFYAVPTSTNGINCENWYASPLGFDTVMEELAKCGSQVSSDIKRIMNLTSIEMFDVYDENGIKTGRTVPRGTPMNAGEYNLSVLAWIRDKEGRYLITRRAPNKTHPLKWECPGGGVSSGQDSLEAVLREVQEETGITLDSNAGVMVKRYKTATSIVDVWVFKHETDLSLVKCQPFETTDAKLASKGEILEMFSNGEFVPFTYLEEILVIAEK